MYPIKYIKLSTGDDIVAQVDMKTLKNGELVVVNPQKVSIIEQVGFLSMALVKWIPWEDGQRIPINKRHVVTVSNCQPVMHDYYHKTEAKIKNYKGGNPQDDNAVAITGQVIEDQQHQPRMSEKEVAKTAAKLRKMFKETVEGEEKSKLDEIMEELNDKDKNTIH